MRSVLLMLLVLALCGCRSFRSPPLLAQKQYDEREAFWVRTLDVWYPELERNVPVSGRVLHSASLKSPVPEETDLTEEIPPPVRRDSVAVPVPVPVQPPAQPPVSLALPQAVIDLSTPSSKVPFSIVSDTAQPTDQAGTRLYTVRKGDSLSSIAKQHYGDGNQWKKIFQANRDIIASPDQVKPGLKIRIP